MSSTLRSTMPFDSKTIFDEHRWVIRIRQTLEEELEDDDDEFPVSIFNVPKPLMASDPDSYIPQLVAIGPYHYWRSELNDIERHKLAAAKRLQKQLQSLKLEHLVHQMMKLEQRIRASYHKYLNFNGETLTWMMVVDASFLLEFLHVYAIQEGTAITGISSRMSHLLDYAGRKSVHNAILRDIAMLENQIPLFVLRKMLEFKFSSLESADDMLLSMLTGLFEELSPFKMMEDYPEIQVSDCEHLLDFFYDMIVPKFEEQGDLVELEVQHGDGEGNEKSILDYVQKLLSEIWRLLSKVTEVALDLVKKILQFRPMKIIIMLPWTIISNLPGFWIMKQPVEHLFFPQVQESKAENGNSGLNNLMNRSPLMEEITIPSVTELLKSGFCFLPTNGGISTIGFDAETATLYLPIIGLDVNTEVLLRNLVAYEASTASGPLIFTRYIELMNGIIDSDEDAKILRENGIILSYLKSDEEVASMWNGMSKSIRLTKVQFLDKVIEDVNNYYNGRFSLKVGKFMKLYVFASWRFLTFFAAFSILLLMFMQVFNSFYRCRHNFHLNTR
ncbi:hypothetical protein L6164_006600 [Bauhinia variegata]|uniref:Uncharacterized protein n=1 Tax=Bauhinia variegata TaxID=167791 RepID=A0ACB9PX04_BAUVA|nr:hypothetical protein L6164_006600 [Bauhinia variegata]